MMGLIRPGNVWKLPGEHITHRMLCWQSWHCDSNFIDFCFDDVF
jgi:hypothetical protein